MSNIVIEAENLSKAYQIGEIGTGTISRDLERWWAKTRGREDPFVRIGETNDRTKKSKNDIVWSLRDINFKIEEGDAVGIIGRNGAGKSTLLKVLSKVTSPTTGKIIGKGRIASLLEVGTGFHPELTGRENIYLNGAILGMRKREITKKFDEIVDFSGVERYIDTPVKRYSSGMYVRLAFAVAAYLESEILIVDEVLSVGDAEFQRKCLGKMGDVSKGEGRTVLFVSHNMDSILNLCEKSMFIEMGSIANFGNTAQCIKDYLNHTRIDNNNVWKNSESRSGPFFSYISNEIETQGENKILKINFQCSSNERAKPAFVAFDIKNAMGITVMQALPQIEPFIPFLPNTETKFECLIDVTGLIPDKYYISPWIGPHYSETYDFPEDIVCFEIITSNQEGRTFGFNYDHGFFVPKSSIIPK